MRSTILIVMLSFLTMTQFATTANAITLDMEGIAPTNAFTSENNATHTMQGFELSFAHGHFADSLWNTNNPGLRAANGTDVLWADTPTPVSLSRVGGVNPFSLTSFDATDIFTVAFLANIEFRVMGTITDGSIINASFISDASTNFETFSLSSAWTNLKLVKFSVVDDGITPAPVIGGNARPSSHRGAYDNIVVSTTISEPIPVPTTIALLGLGYVGLAGGAARRKWKKKAVHKS